MNNNYIKLAELSYIHIIDGDRGKNYPSTGELMSSGFCLFLNAGNVTEKGFVFNELKYITKQKDELLRNGKLERNDIILTTRGTVGNVAIYDKSIPFDHIRINSGMVIIRVNESKIIPQYLYNILRSSNVQNQINSLKTGSAQPQLPISLIKQIKIPIPDTKEQQAIADVLSSFDDKIELNNKIIKNLEEQAQGLYKHWFVDFEFPNEEGKPYKSSGGKFKDSELGLIPEEWKIKKLGDFFPVITGKKNANVACTSGQYPFFSCSQDILYCNEFSFDNSAILVAGNGDFSVKVYEGKFEAYQRTYVLIPNEKKILGFLYYAIKSNLEKLTSGFRGSVIKFITKGHIEDFKLAYHDKMNQYIGCFTNTIRTKAQLLFENKKLEEIRDYLLQKLMNGEIKIADVK